MSRLLSLVLILTILTSRSASSVHAHGGVAMKDGHPHACGPHFHIHGHHHHGTDRDVKQHEHSGRSVAPEQSQPVIPCHDGDACFIVDSAPSATHRIVVADARTWSPVEMVVDPVVVVMLRKSSVPIVSLKTTCLCSIARVPLYLRTLAILC